MSSLNKIIAALVLLLLLSGGIFYLGWRTGRPSSKGVDTVTSTVLLEQIQDQYFLVTKTLFLDTAATITIDESSGWKGFFLGKSIDARGLIRVDIGVDLQGMRTDDIVVHADTHTIGIRMPRAMILDRSVFGDIEVKRSSGIWTNIKELFSDSSNADYNRAVQVLMETGERTATAREEIFDEAENAAFAMVSFIVLRAAPGYSTTRE